MEIKENNFTQDELEMIRIDDDKDHMYDETRFSNICKQIIIDKTDNGINKGYFKVFAYGDSLRFWVFMTNSPSEEAVKWFANEINKYIDNTDKDTVMLRYAQINGFSDVLLDKLANYTNSYRYCHYFIDHDDININVDMKGLEKRRCTEDMIDSCIEIMEELFTPFPDPPGTFRQDNERIKREYMNNENGGAELFFKDNILIGFCGHNRGHFTEVCVKKEYQGKGYGKVIIRSALQSAYELGYNAELYVRYDNTKAIHLYEKAGFKKTYEAVRVNLIRKV